MCISLVGVVVMGMILLRIVFDLFIGQFFIILIFFVNRVMDILKEILKVVVDVVVNIWIGDVMEEGVQKVVLIKVLIVI